MAHRHLRVSVAMTTARFRFHGPSPQPAERDPADDSFAEHVRVPGACVVCGVQVGDTWSKCEACRYAVVGEMEE